MNNTPFDLTAEYDEMLNRGIRLSGEDKRFFMTGRIRDLQHRLPATFRPRRILDFGCGLGDTSRLLADTFPEAEVIGVDTSVKALNHAESKYGCSQVSFSSLDAFCETSTIDMCYVNGVFHHVTQEQRLQVVKMIHKALLQGGYFALFENNPWNPGTRLVMRRIPFDRDACPLTPLATRRLLRDGGFSCLTTRFLFYFPRPLAFLRFAEPWLVRLPLGAQYYVLAVK